MSNNSARLVSAAAALVRSGVEIIVLLDASGIVQVASPGIFTRFGVQSDDLVGRRLFDLVHASDRQRLNAELAQLVGSENGSAVRLEYRVVHADGSTRWIRTAFANYLADPAIGAVVATCQDVTDYRETGAALVASQSRFQVVFANTLDALLLCDDERHYVDANSAACGLLGRTRDETLRLRIDDVTPELHRPDVADQWDAFLSVGCAGGEHMVLRADGTHVLVESRAVANVVPGTHLSVLRDISARQTAQQAARSLQQELRALTARLHVAQEVERHRIAREVHDELGQLLTALKLDLAWTKRRLGARRLASMKGFREKCENMSRVVDDAISSIRRIASGLHPSELDQLGLVAAIEAHIREFSARSGIVVNVLATIEDSNLNPEVCAQLFRITQEAITNVSRHARATAVTITLDHDALGLRLVVTDNGCGMATLPSGSLGLLGMKERAWLCGGELIIDSAPGRGTSVRVLVPTNRGLVRPGSAVDS